jgi:hypothetical protein
VTAEPSTDDLRDVERALCESDSELQVHLVAAAGRVRVKGRVASAARRDEVLAAVRERVGVPVDDELQLDDETLSRVPSGSEEIP